MRKILIHIGFWKTGTTTIQESLYKGRNVLEKAGVCYPSISSNHVFFPSRFHHDPDNFIVSKSIGKKGKELIEWHRSSFLKFEKEIDSFDRVIISSEFFLDLNVQSIERLKQYLIKNFESIEVVAYFRDPTRHLSSAVNEQVKQGHYGLQYALDIHSQCREYKKLEGWIKVFGSENVQLRKFEVKAFLNQNIIDDFLSCWGLNGLIVADRERKMNKSLSHPAVVIADKFVAHFGAGCVPRYLRDILFDIGGVAYRAPLIYRERAYDNAKKEIDILSSKYGVEINFKDVDLTADYNDNYICGGEFFDSMAHMLIEHSNKVKKLKAESMRYQAIIKFKDNQLHAADDLFRKSISTCESFAALRDYAYFLYNVKRYKSARSFCDRALMIHSDRPWLNELSIKIDELKD